MGRFDIVFVGHTYRDLIRRAGHEPVRTVGGALIYGSIAAARAGANVAVVTKLARADGELLAPVHDAVAHVHLIDTGVTSEFEVIYPDPKQDDRVICQRRDAGPFSIVEIPAMDATYLHLAGNAHGEFSLELIRALAARGHRLSLDMQAFVRQPDGEEHLMALKDVPDKTGIVDCLDVVKLDSIEAAILTGEDDPERAARTVAEWGCPEVMITQREGVFGMLHDEAIFEEFSNSSSAGRNGRGDTTLAAYLARRIEHSPAESLAFAAALASIKLEKPGPFGGTLHDVLARMGKRKS